MRGLIDSATVVGSVWFRYSGGQVTVDGCAGDAKCFGDLGGALPLGVSGLGSYFRTGNVNSKCRQINAYVASRLHQLPIRKRGRNLKPGQWLEWTENWFTNHGLYRLRGSVRYPRSVSPCQEAHR